MNGRTIAIAAVAGLVAFAAAFGIAKAGSGGDDGAKKAAAPAKGEPAVALEPAEVAGAKVAGVSTGGTLASFKPKKKKPSSSGASSTPSTDTATDTGTTTPDTSTDTGSDTSTTPPVVDPPPDTPDPTPAPDTGGDSGGGGNQEQPAVGGGTE